MHFQKIPPHAEKVYEGILHSVYHWQQELFDGSFATFEAIKHRPSVATIALTPDKKMLILHEEQPYNGKYITIPGGVADSDDILLEAQRELLEETGYKSDSWEVWQTIDVVDYSKIEWKSHLFIARDCYKAQEPVLDGGELITVEEVTIERFIDLVLSDDFAIDYLKNVIADDTERAFFMSLV